MKKIILLILLTVSMNVFAEWTPVTVGSDGETPYLDFETIKKKGNKVKFWILLDFTTTASENGVMSETMHYEIDCEEETAEMLDLNQYSGNLGRGSTIASYSYANKEKIVNSIPPKTTLELFSQLVCGTLKQ